tara:strand:- start:1295 stop:1750 length:456 start_codon:yes stop_codon:yes gene_type:complete
MVQILAGIVIANFYEWVIHRFILHGLGKRKRSFFHFHWQHHNIVRSSQGFDDTFLDNGYFKEKLSLFFLGLVHSPIALWYPALAATMGVYLFAYYFIHMKAHLDPEWARKWVPWHWDHHMGKNQDMNWCVVMPLCDILFRTREKYFRSEFL